MHWYFIQCKDNIIKPKYYSLHNIWEIHIQKKVPSYLNPTIRNALHMMNQNFTVVFNIGRKNFPEFDTWKYA